MARIETEPGSSRPRRTPLALSERLAAGRDQAAVHRASVASVLGDIGGLVRAMTEADRQRFFTSHPDLVAERDHARSVLEVLDA